MAAASSERERDAVGAAVESLPERARRETQEMLEQEFGYLFGAPRLTSEQGGAPDVASSPSGSVEDRETALRRSIHRLPDDAAPWALCLSGGGIRSATFSLGVLQGLASCGLLDRFTYLSTVSGGGYIGSWLSRWIRQAQAPGGPGTPAASGGLDTVVSALKGGTEHASAPEPEQLSRLRAYSNYLSPVRGLSADFFSLVSIVSRNLVLNWLVLLPLLAAVLMVPMLYLGVLGMELPFAAGLSLVFLAVFALVLGIGYVVADLPGDTTPSNPPPDRFVQFCFLPVFGAALLLSVALKRGIDEQDWISAGGTWLNTLTGLQFESPEVIICVGFVLAGALVHMLACYLGLYVRRRRVAANGPGGDRLDWGDLVFVIVAGIVGGAVLYMVTRWMPQGFAVERKPLLYAVLAVPALLMTFWLATTIYVALVRSRSSEGEREWWARSGGWWIRAAVCWVAGFVLVLYAPQWVLRIPGYQETSAETLILGGGLWGLATGMIGYWAKSGAAITSRARSLASILGARLLDLVAIAFILGLLIGLCLLLSWGIGTLRGEQAAVAPDESVSAERVIAAAQATEAAAHLTAAVARAADRTSKPLPASGATASEPRPSAQSVDGRGASVPAPGAAPTISETVRASVEELAHATEIAAGRLRLAGDAVRGTALELRRAAEAAGKSALAVAEADALVLVLLPVQGSAARAAPTHAQAEEDPPRAALARAKDAAAAVTSRLVRESEHLAGRDHPSQRYAAPFLVSGAWVWILFSVLLAMGVVTSMGVGINTFSLHGMYGNRLVRAYFGAARAGERRHPHWFTGFDDHDNVAMSELVDPDTTQPRRLFHVVNLALNLVAPSAGRLEWQQRKAASFTVTPLRAGSAELGFVCSRRYAGPENEGISLARAMTISGAAASPNMGYHSSPAVAFVMTLFNVRLGW